MGCDIHIVLERKQRDEKWIGISTTDITPERGRSLAAQRDYALFTMLANVRGSGGKYYPKNLPQDVSELAWDQYMLSPTDNHSVSHLSLEQFIECWLECNPRNERKEHAAYDLFGIDSGWPEGCQYRTVFWFDN